MQYGQAELELVQAKAGAREIGSLLTKVRFGVCMAKLSFWLTSLLFCFQ